jgi:hypothetical protein
VTPAGPGPHRVGRGASSAEQRAAIEQGGLRLVPLDAARGFLSPGLERRLARHVDRATAIVGATAEQRVWPSGVNPPRGGGR